MSQFYSALNSEACGHSGMNLMGSLRCVYSHPNRARLSGYKKRFWVVNSKLNRLEVYKNDQSYLCQHVLYGRDIRNVFYTRDKQNRFYMMILQTRNNHSVRFRMDSSEERERWYAAIVRLVDTYSKTSRCVHILYTAERHCELMSQKLGVRINVEAAQLILNIPSNVFQYVLDAVDAAIGNIAAVVRIHGADMEVPLSYTLFLKNSLYEKDQPFEGAHYDPIKRSMAMNIVLRHDALGRVQFDVTSDKEVLQLLQSDVFRNPLVEGWMTNLPGCDGVCQAIRNTLNSKNLAITFKWGLNFQDSVNTEAYLRRFVDLDFFNCMYHGTRKSLSDVVEVLQKDEPQVELLLLLSDFLNPITFSLPLRLKSKQRPHDTDKELHFDPQSICGKEHSGSHSRKQEVVQNFYGCDEELSKLVLFNCAAGLISKNVTGLAIMLDEKLVQECKHSPPLRLEYSLEYGQRLRPTLLLLNKYRKVFRESLRELSCEVPLRRQLFEVALQEFLHRKVLWLRSKLSRIFNKRIKVVVEWDHLFFALRKIGAKLPFKYLVSLMNGLSKHCIPRLQKMVRVLMQAPDALSASVFNDAPLPMNPPKNSLFEVFGECVSILQINFTAFVDDKDLKGLEPTIREGVLVDTLTCMKSDMLPRFLQSLRGHHPNPPSQVCVGVASTTSDFEASELMHEVQVCSLTPNLGAWCVGYFASPERPVPLREDNPLLLDDEFEGCSDMQSAYDPIPELSFGEMVANERSAETRVFNMKRVVNSVYDSQGDHVNLKIGARSIMQAIRSLSRAFGGKKIMKHDLLRVIVANLHRLRQLYCELAGKSRDMLLSEENSELLLRNFCEYSESEEGILFLLRSAREFNLGSDAMLPSSYLGYMSGSVRRPFDSVHTQHNPMLTTNEPFNKSPPVSTRRSSTFSSTTLVQTTQMHNGNCDFTVRSHPGHGVDPELEPRNACVATYTDTRYNFSIICHVALNCLLPREAILAKKAWRTGFVFGLENVGKSLIINSISGVAVPTVATVGLSEQVVSFHQWVFSLRELGGRESFRMNWMYYRKNLKEVDFLFFVMDCMNRHTFHDAYRYLKSVTNYYKEVPLVVVFNNYKELPRKLSGPVLENHIRLDKIRGANPHRVIITTICNITVVHSSFRTIPESLAIALRQLSNVLLVHCPEQLKPSIPKGASEIPVALSSPEYLITTNGTALENGGSTLRSR